jgi:arylsulfatase A-like enzyme
MAESDAVVGGLYSFLKKGILFTSNDAVLILIVTVVGIAIILMLQRSGAKYATTVGAVAALLSISTLSMISLATVPLYRWPLTFDLLEYSRFFSDPVAQEYVYSFVPAQLYLLGASALILTAAGVWLFLGLHRAHFISRPVAATAALAITPLVVLYVVVSQRALSARQDDHMFINAAVAFALSAATPPLERLMGYDDGLVFAGAEQRMKPFPKLRFKPTNVIVFVMESVGARYLDAYGAKYGATPNYDGLLANSIFFERAYAHAPSSSIALQAMLGSSVPISPYRVQPETSEPSNPTLVSELAKNGVRTAFFTSGTPYASELRFIVSQGFGTVRDASQIGCDHPPMISVEDNTRGQADRCTVEALLEWIDAESGRPFFAVQWTYQTHYPYFTRSPGAKLNLPSTLDPWTKAALGRYLNALRESDADLGYIVEQLRLRGLEKSTLLVVIGDHGEAFGQHGFGGHGSDIYEESVHIPLAFINPNFGQKFHYRSLFGQVDLAPTLADILGAAPISTWAGNSIFVKERDQVFFFAKVRDTKIGFRRGTTKYILNLPAPSILDIVSSRSESDGKKLEKYDLSTDPSELADLGVTDAAELSSVKSDISRWLRSLPQ